MQVRGHSSNICTDVGKRTLFANTESARDGKDHSKDLGDESVVAQEARVVDSVEVADKFSNSRAASTWSVVGGHDSSQNTEDYTNEDVDDRRVEDGKVTSCAELVDAVLGNVAIDSDKVSL